MAKAYKVHDDGSCDVMEVEPKNKKFFTYEELRDFIGGSIEIVPLPSGKSMVVHEEGKLIGLRVNGAASDYWLAEYPLDQYPNNNDGIIAGNALVCTEAELAEEEN